MPYNGTMSPEIKRDVAPFGEVTGAHGAHSSEDTITFIADLARELMDAVSLDEVYRRTALAVYRISGALHVLVSGYDRETRKLAFTAMAGMCTFDDLIPSAGADIRTLRIAPAELGAVAIASAGSGILTRLDGLYDLFVGKLPRAACNELERSTGMKAVYSIGICWDGRIFGNIALLFGNDLPPRTEMIEAMARIASVAMRRMLGEEERVHEQRIIAEVSRVLVSASTLDEMYTAIGPTLRRESGAEYLFVSGYDAVTGRTTMRHSEGFSDIIQSLIAMVGRHPRDIAPKRDELGEPIASAYDTGRFVRIPGGLYELSGKSIPKGIVSAAGRILGVRDIYGMGFSWDGKAHGVVTFFYREGSAPRNIAFVETLIQLVTMAVRRRIAEEERLSDEESFRRLVEHAPSAVFICVGAVFAYVNEAAVGLFGAASKNDLIGSAYLERIHPDSRAMMREHIRGLEERRSPVHNTEVNYVTMSDARIIAEISAVPFAYGSVDGMLVFASNVTQRKRHERELVSQRELLQTLAYFQRDLLLLDTVGIIRSAAKFLAGSGGIAAVILIDDERGIAHMGMQGERYDRIDHVLGELDGSSIDSVARSRAPLYLRDIDAGSVTNGIEAGLYRDHSLRAAMYMPIVYEQQCLGVLAVFSRTAGGITDEAQSILPILSSTTALALRKADLYDAVKRSEAWYRTLIERSPEAVIIYNVTTNAVIDCNENAIRLFGYSCKEQAMSTDDPSVPDHFLRAFINEQYRVICEGGQASSDFTIKNAAGTPVPVEARVVSLPPRDSGIVRISIIDVSDRVRLEEERRRTTQSVMQNDKMKALGELATGMAHEITQPLTGISLATQLIHLKLTEGGSDPQMLKGKLNDIADYVQRIKSIIEHVRMFARDRSGDVPCDFSCARAVANALSLVGAQYRSNGVELTNSVMDESVLIHGNIYEFEQVVLNVLANAKYAVDEREKYEKQGYKKRIALSCSAAGQAVLEVHDNGIGIKAEHRDKIFDPFFTTKPVDKGSGLGLAFSFGIIRDMGGTITCDSSEGEYTVMRITVPCRAGMNA